MMGSRWQVFSRKKRRNSNCLWHVSLRMGKQWVGESAKFLGGACHAERNGKKTNEQGQFPFTSSFYESKQKDQKEKICCNCHASTRHLLDGFIRFFKFSARYLISLLGIRILCCWLLDTDEPFGSHQSTSPNRKHSANEEGSMAKEGRERCCFFPCTKTCLRIHLIKWIRPVFFSSFDMKI